MNFLIKLFSKTVLKKRLDNVQSKYAKYFPVFFFLSGFIFDVVTLSRIDSLLTLVQHAVFLVFIGILLTLDMLNNFGVLKIHKRVNRIWESRTAIIHFLFGSLLSSFTLFYFKSASLLGSFLFFIVLAVLLVMNESSRFRRMRFVFRFALYSLCLSSYFAYLIPILIGSVGEWIFMLSVLSPTFIFWIIYRILKKRIPGKLTLLSQTVFPAAAVQALFLILYMLQAIPPVPLSIQYMGIYHNVEKIKDTGRYHLFHERPFWRFWENGDQVFRAREGDKIFVFARIFSPSGFQDDIKLRWLYYDEKHRRWQKWDIISINIRGGRAEGFRGYANKSNYTPGKWRVQIETDDEREIGRIYFEVIADTGEGIREFATDLQ